MVNGDPIDPIPFELATKELWGRLAAHAGVNLQEHRLYEDDAAPEWRDRELLLQSLWSEARDMLLGIIICHARWWTAEGEKWRRPPPETITTIIRTKGPDEPWGVFVDRQEIESVLATFRPELDAARPSADVEQATPKRSAKKPGPKKGPGYKLEDVRVFEMILSAQRQSGDIKRQYALVKKFADEAEGTSFSSKVDRLRKGLPKWLEQNGHEWKRSN